MIPHIKPNDTSFAVAQLHLVMQLLKLSVDSKERLTKTAGKSTQEKLRAWQKQQHISINEKVLVDAATVTALGKVLNNLCYLETSLRNMVSGKVFDSKQNSVSKIRLLAFDLDLKGVGRYKSIKSYKQLLSAKEGFDYLGQAISRKDGFYEVVYYDWMFFKSERKRADVVVFALIGDTIVERSRFIQNADRTTENVDIILKKTKKKFGEYKPLYKKVAAFLKENQVTFKEVGQEQDYIAFIAAELDIDQEKLQHLIAANLLNDDCDKLLVAELLYGLKRQGISLAWNNLISTSIEVLENAIHQAITACDIDAFSKGKITDFLDNLKISAAENLLKQDVNTPNIADDLLQLSLKSKSDRVTFAKLSANYQGVSASGFWDIYLPKHSKFDVKTIQSLQEDQEIFTLSRFYLPLAKEIKKSVPKALKTLVKWDSKKWLSLIEKVGVPPHIKGETANVRINNYVRELEKSVNTKFPTAAIQHKISTKNIHIAKPKVQASIDEFFSTSSDFNIKTSSIKGYEDTIKYIAGQDVAHQKEVLDEVNALQRMVRMNPDVSLIGKMKENRLTAAHLILEYPKKTFALEFGKDFGGEEYALEVYERAATTSVIMNRVVIGTRTTINKYTPKTLISHEEKERLLERVEERFPGYSEVFNINLCECRHCNSVYSPAAYFVDLMRYLERGVKKEEKSPSDVFRERRPDLFHLRLTCENSNTLIPYIDLANEVMESYIFHDKNIVAFSFYRSEDTGDLTAEELRTQPQFVKKETYFTLSEAVFPLTMPYHLPLETLRLYSEQMGTSWYQILKTIQSQPVSLSSQNYLRATFLGLTEKDFEILTANNYDDSAVSIDLKELYGVGSLANLTAVQTFLKQTGLKYTELVQLIKTNYINPNLYLIPYLDFLFQHTEIGTDGLGRRLSANEIYGFLNNISIGGAIPPEISRALTASDISQTDFISWVRENFDGIKSVLTLYEPDSECDLNTTKIQTIRKIYDPTAGAITEAVWRKLLRIIRLWRKTKWSLEEVDALVSSLTMGTFNTAFLKAFSYARQFIDTTGITPKRAALLWGDFNYRADGNLYAKLFLNRSVEISEVFIPKLGSDLFDGLDTTHTLLRYHPDLQAAFKVTEEDLNLIYEYDGTIAKTDTISIAHISTLYRYLLFGELCKISIADLISYARLFELRLFVNPFSSLESYEQIKKIVETDFTIEELAYVFKNTEIDSASIALQDDDLIENIGLLYNEYVGVDEEITDVSERLRLKRTFTYNMLSDYLTLSVEVVEVLMDTHIDDLVVAINGISIGATGEIEDVAALLNETVETSPKSIIKRLHRASITIDGFQLETTEVVYLIDNTADFGGLDMKDPTVAIWWRLYDYASLKESIPDTKKTLIDIFEYANSGVTASIEQLKMLITEVTQWNTADVVYLVDEIYNNLDLFKNEKILVQMQNPIQLANTMGIAVASLYSLERSEGVGLDPLEIFNDFWERAHKLKRLLKAKYNHSTWTNVATKLNDTLREQRRDALVAYLLQMEVIRDHELEIIDANGLYEFFLLDVQMSACMETSRMVQASAAIQQFVNRTHLNLEKHVLVEALDRYRWSWMKHYRVWEAQMRVWYENETLLNPEWRLDKSPFFKQLESHLTQNDITDRTAEEALRGYLKSMDEVSNLNIAGMYEEKDADGYLKLLHVFGHTNNTPYTYYYRTYNEFGKWSAWEKIDAAIQAVSYSESDSSDVEKKTGVHLIPVVWKNRLFLFWPEFMEKVEPVNTREKTFKELAADDGPTIASQQSKKYWEVRLAWSEYYDGKWTAKQVSEESYSIKTHELLTITMESFVLGPDYRDPMELKNISFSTNIRSDNSLEIYMTPFVPRLGNQGVRTNHEDINYGNLFFYSFKINNLSNNVKIINTEVKLKSIPYGEINRYTNSIIQGKFLNNFFEGGGYNFMKSNRLNNNLRLNNLYLNSEVSHQLIFPNQLKYEDLPIAYPFFYSAENKNYFVKQKYLNEAQELLNEAIELYGPFLGILLGGTVAAAAVQVLEFNSFHHPYVSNFISNLNKNGISTGDSRNPGLLESDISIGTSDGIYDDHGEYFKNSFDPNFGLVFEPEIAKLKDPLKTYFKETIDFDIHGANSRYNWELFYHAPLYIATQLSKNGKHHEALKWFHYIFDPTTDSPVETGTDVNAVARFFKVKPFKTTPTTSFEDFITGLSANAVDSPENKIIKEWKNNAFDPHLVATSFPVNYMKHVILAYVENLVQWGDNLFRRFTRENVYEAIQLYVIAGHILGPKPQFIPERGVVKRETYATISSRLNDLSNAYGLFENSLPYSSDLVSTATGEGTSSLLGIGSALYFCIPPNEKLMKYWDIVEDRLYKIRHCKDINGIARRLALFAPPIDPAALIKARNAGLDLEDLLQGLYAPNPHYRFTYLLQKANEFCNDVKALGNALLSAIEKQESEALNQIRSTHEIEMLGMVQKIKERQILDARTAQEVFEKQRETAIFRFNYYNETLLGEEAVQIPSIIDLELDLDENSQITVNPDIQEIIPDVNVVLLDTDEEGIKLIEKEKEEIDKRAQSNFMTNLASGISAIAAPLNLIPSFSIQAEPFGVGGSISFGGQNLSASVQSHVNVLQIIAAIRGQEAAKAATTASYIRREQDWTLQANLAAKEIQQLERQILSAGIRVQIAEKDLANHKRQIENAETIENYIKNKFTNKELYQWMKEQLISVHKESYDLAFQLAKQAEMAFEFEKRIESSESTYINYGYFDNSKNGLLSGEKLQLALRQLELAYQEKNTREFELTKHISLKRLNPEELMKLRITGKIERLVMPEWPFTIDNASLCNMRIKRVGISIPAIAGPHTSINCKLTLLESKIRVRPEAEDSALEPGTAAINAIVTSNAQNDDGMFETNFREERYLPFEGAGVISMWNLELPELKQFDYNTITDCIFHISFTAIEGGDIFKDTMISKYQDQLGTITDQGLYRLFEFKHDFPNEWHRFNIGETVRFEAVLQDEHFPYFAPASERTIVRKTLLTIQDDGSFIEIDLGTTDMILEIDATYLDSTLESFVIVRFTI